MSICIYFKKMMMEIYEKLDVEKERNLEQKNMTTDFKWTLGFYEANIW